MVENWPLFFFYILFFKRNTDTNNTGPCRTMDIMMIDSQMCLHNKWEKKESYNCTDNINTYKNITFVYKKSANVKAKTNMHITHDSEWGMGDVAKRLGSQLLMHHTSVKQHQQRDINIKTSFISDSILLGGFVSLTCTVCGWGN